MPTTPAVTGQANNTGYIGQTLTINGTGFQSGATVTIGGVSVAMVYVNSGQLTAVVPVNAANTTVAVSEPAGNVSASFTNLGYLTNANTDWNTGTTWLGSAVPPVGATVSVNNNITVNNTVTSAYYPASITVLSGSKITFGASGNLSISNQLTIAGTVDMSNGGVLNFTGNGTFTNNGTFTYGTGTVNFTGNSGVSTVNGSNATSFYDVSIAGSGLGINMGPPISTIIHSFTINSGTYFVTNAPIYATNSTLIYNIGGNYNRNVEWSQLSGSAYPYNVEVSNNTNLNISYGTGLSDGTARAIAGTLTIDNGSTVTMNSMTTTLTTAGLVNNGTFILSSAYHGDYVINGNWTNNGTFTPQTRAVQFSGANAQTIGGTAATTFDYLTIDNSNGVSLNTSIGVNSTLTFTTGNLILGAYNATLTAGCTVAGAGASGYVQTNSTGQLKETVGNSATYFTVGNSAYNPIVFTNSGTQDVYGVNVIDGTYGTANDANDIVNERWQVTEAVAGGSNLAVVTQWNGNQQASGFAAASGDYIGFYNGSAWTENAATQSGSDPYYFTSNNNFTPANLTSGVQYFAMGKNDAFFCPASVNIAITTGSQTTCSGTPITFTATPANGGAGPLYQWKLNGANQGSNSAVATFTSSSLAQGDAVTCVMTSNAACVAPASASVTSNSIAMTVNSSPQGSLTANGPFCQTGTGVLTWTATAGASPFTVIYNDGVANRTVNGVTSGTGFNTFTNPVTATTSYTLVSVANATCSTTSGFTNGSAIIKVNPLPVFTASGTNATCAGTDDGKITVNVTTGSAPYTYSTDNGVTYPYSASPITNLSPSTYQVNVTDNNGCVGAAAQTVNITAPAAPTTQDNTLHFTAVTGGSMTVSWTNGNGSNHLVEINTADAFNTPVDNTAYTANTAYSGSGIQVVYNGTGNSVTITGLSANALYWVNVYGFNSVGTCLLYNTSAGADNPLPNINYWVGTVSNVWNLAANWGANTVPNSCASNVLIPAVTSPHFSPTVSSAVQVGDLFVSDGAIVNLGSGGTLSSCGNFTGGSSTGATLTGSGVYILNGSSAQTISGIATISELKIANTSGGVALAGNAVTSVTTALDLSQGNINVSAGKFIFTSSSTTQSAILDNFSPGNTGGSITGSVYAERSYDASNYAITKQHMMGSPVSAPMLSQFGAGSSSGTVVPNNCDEDYLDASSPYGNVFGLVENTAAAAACGVASWTVESGLTPAVNGQGYSVILQNSGVLTVNGLPNVAPSYALDLTNSNWTNTTAEHHTLTSGWHLLSNPYLATMVLNTSGGSGIDAQVQVWQSNQGYTGSYQPGINHTGQVVLAPFQAFMVHVTNQGTETFTISGNDRSRTTPSTFYTQNANELDIVAENLNNNLLDRTVVAFNSASTDSFDTRL